MNKDEDSRFKGLIEDAKKAAEVILEHTENEDFIRVITHFDADGLSAGGLIASALYRLNAIFSIRAVRWVDRDLIEEVLTTKTPLTIFIDFGSGYLDLIKKIEEGEAIILDHHQPSEISDGNFIHVNPHLHGIDGARDISGAGVAYLTAREIDEKNKDLSYLGIVGALADLQDKYSNRSLGGVNSIILEDALNEKVISVEKDLLFFGRETKPIHKALANTMEPFIPGISGEEDKSLAFLINIGIKPKNNDKWRALRDLTKEEKKTLFSELASLLTNEGVSEEIVMSLIGTIYILRNEEPWTPLRDAREFASLLNATGRMNRPGLGISICAGDRESALKNAMDLLREYRRTIMRYVSWIREGEGRFQELDSFYLIRGGTNISERMIGTISNLFLTTLPRRDKPLIAYSIVNEENIIKISARGTNKTVRKGINLGEIMREAAEKFSGMGGGHDVAAGAQIPIDRLDYFLRIVDSLIKERLKSN